MKAPNSRRNLDIAIQRKYGLGDEYMRARTVMANAIVGQMLPDGAVKGGSAIKLRFGESVTRFTTDLDVARAHDLIDLQVMAAGERIDLRRTRETCERLFVYRDQQPWPPTVVAGDTWSEAYEVQRRGLDVLESAEDAVAWANELIAQIASA